MLKYLFGMKGSMLNIEASTLHGLQHCCIMDVLKDCTALWDTEACPKGLHCIMRQKHVLKALHYGTQKHVLKDCTAVWDTEACPEGLNCIMGLKSMS